MKHSSKPADHLKWLFRMTKIIRWCGVRVKRRFRRKKT